MSDTRLIKRNAAVAGFSMIEILVVLVILGMMAAVVVPNLIGRTDDARITLAKQELHTIGNALEMYKLDNFHYPSTSQGLRALVRRPPGRPTPRNWKSGGYLRKLPIDPWDTPYQYKTPGSGRPYDLFTFGADGRRGGRGEEADISVWDD